MTPPERYCKGCYYNLRGLPADVRRCPECGRHFNPDIPATTSPTPTPERFKKVIRQITRILNDAVTLPDGPATPAGSTLASLSRWVARLQRENDFLWRYVGLLTHTLVAAGLVAQEDVDELRLAMERDHPADPAQAVAHVEDDTPDDPDPVSDDLLDLGRAAGTIDDPAPPTTHPDSPGARP